MRDKHRPAGLKLRGSIWHIDKIITVEESRHVIRESTGCSTIKEAARVLTRRVAEVRAQLIAGPIIRERTYLEAAAEYIADLERRGKDSARALLDVNMLIDTIGSLPLSHVHQRAIQDWIDVQKGTRSSGTVARALRTTSAVLNLAARVLRDGNQPWLGCAVPKLIAPDWGTRQPIRITWDEQDRLIAALPALLVPPVLFALATGARQAEITTLRWDQHRRVEGLPGWAAWWIPPEVRKGNARKSASDQEGRYIVCNATARAVIEQQDRTQDLVFPSRSGAAMDRVNNRTWRAAVKTAGLAIRFHDLRHTFGERLATAGVPFDARKTILGHHHNDITAHYSTPGLSRLIEEAEKVRRPSPTLAVVAAKAAG